METRELSREKPIITYEILAKAIKNKLEVTDDVADDISFRVLNYFGYDDEIIDNALDQDDRRMFYFLQDVQLLSTHWEEAILPTGRTWRVFYWVLNTDRILKYSSPKEEEPVGELGLYDSLPENVWSRSMA
jgi:hypothetical protein